MGQQYRYRPGEIVPGTGLKIIRPLGSGGMGAVYEVEETSVEAPFVMKVVHPHLLLTSGSRVAERMRQEAKTQARLNHDNIVRVYRAGVTTETPPLPFYVMDRLSGYAVRQVLRWHRNRRALIPMSWVFWIGASLLQALDHAHKNGVIHRDVKPDNIFIHHREGHKPVVKLLDFGIMAAVSDFSDQKRLTVGGTFAGTYTHAAPEQLQGASPAPALDIYAVGMVLYEMLAGRHPFEDRETPEAIIHAHLHEPPPPINQRPGLHPKLEALVHQMLAKDPNKRPQSAKEAVTALAMIKTEWMQQSVDGSASNELDFHFEADIGERWPTNVEGEDGFSLHGGPSGHGDGASSSGSQGAALLAAPELVKVPALELSSKEDPAVGSVPTRAGWGGTVDGKGPLRVSHVLAAAIGFALLSLVASWLWMRGGAVPESATTATHLETSTARAPEPNETLNRPATPPPPVPEAERPSTSLASPAVPPSAAPAASAGHERGPTKRQPALAKTGAARQSPGVQTAPTTGRNIGDELMQP